MRKFYIILFFPILFVFTAFSQEEKKETKYALSGYVSNMQSVMFDSISGNFINDNLIHNRIKFKWFPTHSLTFNTELRNRIFTGESIKYTPNYSNLIGSDAGWMDLSFNLIDEKSIFFNSTIDRAFINFEKNKFSISLGRQRINWGKCFAWNPNDIFNSYSFFDFDYEEKPGSDAIRLKYFTSSTSNVEIAAKLNNEEKMTGAAYFNFNKSNFDYQFIAGIVDEQDFILGTGWSGDIKGVDFRGEISYLHPESNMNDTTGILLTSIGIDYTFKNSLMLMTEFLYNSNAEISSISDFREIYNAPLTIKNISFAKYNVFAQASYPVTPLINASFSAMYYPEAEGFYFGPTVSYWMAENIDFSIFLQNFTGKFNNPVSLQKERMQLTFCFLRLKYTF